MTRLWLMGALMMAEPAMAVDDKARGAILDAARVPVAETLGKTVRFKVERLKTAGPWAFLYADMEDAQGRPVSYEGTSLADAARAGAVSRSYAALLKKADGGWTIIAKAIGPTDVAWSDWAKTYQAPPGLFRE